MLEYASRKVVGNAGVKGFGNISNYVNEVAVA